MVLLSKGPINSHPKALKGLTDPFNQNSQIHIHLTLELKGTKCTVILLADLDLKS